MSRLQQFRNIVAGELLSERWKEKLAEHMQLLQSVTLGYGIAGKVVSR